MTGDRILPDQQFSYKGTLTTSLALITRNDTYPAYIQQIILTNITGNDVTVTITTAETSPTTEATIVVSARDQWKETYEEGWEFVSGIKMLASAEASIRAQVWGKQKAT